MPLEGDDSQFILVRYGLAPQPPLIILLDARTVLWGDKVEETPTGSGLCVFGRVLEHFFKRWITVDDLPVLQDQDSIVDPFDHGAVFGLGCSQRCLRLLALGNLALELVIRRLQFSSTGLYTSLELFVGLPQSCLCLCTRRNVTRDRKSTRLNSSHVAISYAVFCLKKKNRRIPTGKS